MVTTFVVAGILAVVAAGMAWWQHVQWREDRKSELPRDELAYLGARHSRRQQISALLGIVAISLAVGVWISDPLVVGFYWLGVMFALVWVIVLAIVDASSSQVYLERLRSRQQADQAAINRQWLDRVQSGRPDSDPSH